MRPALIAACHTVAMGGRLANARRPVTPSWTFAGTAPLVSDGMSGSYLGAATNAAARVVFPGGGVGPFTLSFWAKQLNNLVFSVGAADGLPLLYGSPAGEFDYGVNDDVGAVGTGYVLADPGGSDLVHIALVCDGFEMTAYGNGVSDGSAPFAITGTFAACDIFHWLTEVVPASASTGYIRSPAIFARPLTSDEIVSLAQDGSPDTNLLLPYVDYTGVGPAHWWPALGDTLPAVIDRGLVGGCNLTANGGITIGSP